MTNFTDRVILRLNNSAPEISPLDIVKNIWWFEDGKWEPIGFSAHGDSYLTLTNYNNDPPSSPLNLFEITVEDTGGEPLLVTDRGFVVQKDISAGGFVASNQGELWLGSGRANEIDMPKIILCNSGASILGGGGYLDLPPVPTGHAGSGSFPPGQPVGTYFLRTDESGQYHNRLYKWDGSNWNDTTPTNTAASQLFRSTDAIFGEDLDTIFESAYNSQTQTWNWSKVGPASDYAGKYFDTLHLIKLDGSAAHLDLGDLTANGKIGLKSTNNVFAVTAGDEGANQDTYLIPQNPSQGGLGLGTAAYPFKWLDATNVFCDVLIKLGSDAMGIPDGIDVGYGVQGRETNAGKIIYQEWSDALDIVGAGTTGSNRKIKFWAEGGAAFAGNITINKATPVLQLKATSGDPIIEFYDTSTLKMNLAYSAAGDYFYLRDIVGSKDVFQATPAGQLKLPVQGSSGGLSIGGDVNLYRGSTNTLYVYRNIEPGAGTETGYLGEGDRYWYGLVAKEVYYKYLEQFYDEYDDLSIAKLWGEKNQTLPEDYDATKLKPPTDDPFKIIKGSKDEANTEEFFDTGKVNSFLMGCVKALAKKQDEHDALLLKMLNEVESLRAKIAS